MDYTTWKPLPRTCSNCEVETEELIDIPGWPPGACIDCATDFLAADEAESLCPGAVAAICAATAVGEMQTLLQEHIRNCAGCRGIPPLKLVEAKVVQLSAPEFLEVA